MPYATDNVTFRCYQVHKDVVVRAAAKAGKTLSDYCRDIVLPWAASDLGERLPPMPPLERNRYQTMLHEAAKRAGLTPEQFERRASEHAAALALGIPTPEESRTPSSPPPPPAPEERPRRHSEMRELIRPQTYSVDRSGVVEVLRRPRKHG